MESNAGGGTGQDPERHRRRHAHRRLVDLARAEAVDNGKPITLARTLEIPRAATNFRFFAAAVTQFATEAHPMAQEAINITFRDPIGIVGLHLALEFAPVSVHLENRAALAMGNCVIAKPSEITPMTAAMLGALCTEAGLPPGVLAHPARQGQQHRQCPGKHPKVKAIAFTGGTAPGAAIAAVAAPAFKKFSLEMGGKNPTLVFADCDYESTVAGVLRAAFANQGQVCLCWLTHPRGAFALQALSR